MKTADLRGRGIVGGPPRAGRTSRILSVGDRHRLRKFQREHSTRLNAPIGIPALRTAMKAPFTWEVLQRALAGKPIWHCYHQFIVSFLDTYVPLAQVAMDYKSRASGERDEPDDDNAESEEAVTHRGSR